MTESRTPAAGRSGRELRAAFLAGPPGGRAGALEELLASGGVLLSNDEELLAHVDFWIGIDPLSGRVAPVAARNAERRPAERDALLVRGAAGRIRDRVRAACLLGHVERLDEETESVLRGLLFDPIPLVGRTAGRAVWWQLAQGAAGLRDFVNDCLRNTGDRDALVGPRRNLTGGLAVAALVDPSIADGWLRRLFDHPDGWTRVAAAEACGQIAVILGPKRVAADLVQRALYGETPESLAAFAAGVRDVGRLATRRAAGGALAGAVRGALEARTATTAEEQFDISRAVQAIAAATISFDPAAVEGDEVAFGPRFERVLGLATRPAGPEAARELLGAFEHGMRMLDEALGAFDASDRASRAAATARLHEVARRVLAEDPCGPLIEVVGVQAETRRRLRGALRALEWRLLGLVEKLSSSSDFLVRREAVRTLAAAMDSASGSLRDRVTLLVDCARSSRTRRAAAGALARLLGRLRLDDPIGFLDVALRLGFQPAKVRRAVLDRVVWFVTDAATRSFVGALQRALDEASGKLRAAEVADRFERVLAVAPASASSAAVLLPPGPAATAMGAAIAVLRHLDGGPAAGRLEGLGPAIAAFARCEANLAWDEVLPRDAEELVGQGAKLRATSEPQQHKSLAAALEKGLSGAVPAALARALRRAARSEAARTRRAARRRSDWMQPRAGDVFHGCEVLRILQVSNCSTVCVGLRPGSHRVVLLKLPTAAVWESPPGREQFLREGHLLRVLPAEHLVRVEELFEDGPPMLVIQFLWGRTLDECFGAGRPWLLRRCLEVLRGLRHVHDLEIVHRDLKPGNVMIVPSGRAVLIDFGVAWLDPRSVTGEACDFESPAGTPSYMAPEQWRWERPIAASDVYALGVMLYEILAGVRPFERDDLEAFRRAHLEEAPPPLPPDVPAPLAATIAAMLAKDPAVRPSLGEVREAIETALVQPLPAGREALPSGTPTGGEVGAG